MGELTVMEKLVIVGAGSQARYVIDIARSAQLYELVGIVDVETADNVGKQLNDVPIACTLDELQKHFRPRDCRLIVAYGQNDRKRDIVRQLERDGFEFGQAVSPLAYVSPTALIGEGCIINPMASVMPNARLGRHVILHSQCVIEHDNVIGDLANIGPGVSLAGRVAVGEGTYIYTGAKVIPDINIGSWAVVAAGALVTRDVADHDTVVGVPARSRRRRGDRP
jgi:sugar O-acyltransferase (sialic acid O-acetyltransferase NeuD family)